MMLPNRQSVNAAMVVVHDHGMSLSGFQGAQVVVPPVAKPVSSAILVASSVGLLPRCWLSGAVSQVFVHYPE